MTCKKNCKTSDVQFTFSTEGGSVYDITVFDNEDVFISFDDDVTEIDIKRDSVGDVYAAGNDFVIRPFTLTVPCTEEGKLIADDWKDNPMSMCGDAELITNCCDDYSFESTRMTGMKLPDIGKTIGTYSFSFEGVAV